MPEHHKVLVVRIPEIEKHSNADSLGIVRFGGYQVVVKLGDFQPGDLAIYIQPDSVLPQEPQYAFVWEGKEQPDGSVLERHRRVTVRKFRKEWSEGLLLPVKVREIPGSPDGSLCYCYIVQRGTNLNGRQKMVAEGDDVAEFLGITHYEPPEPGACAQTHNYNRGVWPKSIKGWWYFLLRKLGFDVNGPTGGDNVRAPKSFPPVYDVEALKNFVNVLEPGEPVLVTEKAHGCVPSTARIRMADDSRKFMRHVKEGDYVLGMNAFGQLVPSKVLRKFENGKADKWLKITGKRTGLGGRGNHYFSVVCTPEHRFWNPESGDYVPAGSLREGDAVLSVRTDLDLIPIQEQVLLGKLLGDGYLAVHTNTATIHWSHREADLDYVYWTAEALGNLVNPNRSQLTSGYGTRMIRQSTVGTASIKEVFESFVQNGKKEVPEWVASTLTPLSVAFWYMDDGSLAHTDGQEDRATFASCAFNQQSLSILVEGLSRLGVKASATKEHRIVLDTINSDRLFLLIAPYIPLSMQRKLPERYRGGSGWLPRSESVFRPSTIVLHVEAITVCNPKSKKFDIETEMNNYFVNNILTHNSNARYTFQNRRFYAGSRKLWKSPKSASIWWKVANQNPWIEQWCREHEGYVLYGEVFPTQGGYNYGRTAQNPGFLVFDILSPEGEWVVPNEVAGVLPDNIVPLLYSGDFDLEHIKNHCVDGPSKVLGAAHIREGCVIRALNDRPVRGLGRCQLKIVSNKFLDKESK